MPLTTEDARRWLSRFDAVARVERAERRRRGPQPEWSCAVARSLIDGALRAQRRSAAVAAIRNREDERVRDAWRRLRRPVVP